SWTMLRRQAGGGLRIHALMSASTSAGSSRRPGDWHPWAAPWDVGALEQFAVKFLERRDRGFPVVPVHSEPTCRFTDTVRQRVFRRKTTYCRRERFRSIRK